MSYDVHLFKPEGGESADEAFERLVVESEEVGEGSPSPEKEALKEQLSDTLTKTNPLLERFHFDYAAVAKSLKTTEEKARLQWRHIELNGPEDGNGIQIIIEDDKASVSVPYWHQADEATRVFEEIWQYLNVFQSEAGYLAYDPQLERPLDLSKDLDEVVRRYSGVVRAVNTEIAATAQANTTDQPKPWWKFW